jgi:hypothetical protein
MIVWGALSHRIVAAGAQPSSLFQQRRIQVTAKGNDAKLPGWLFLASHAVSPGQFIGGSTAAPSGFSLELKA